MQKAKGRQKRPVTNSEILKRYVAIAEMLGEMFAPVLEVVVHNLRRPEASIVAIQNGHITGRRPGDATTDLGRQRLEDDSVPDLCLNYENRSPRGGKLKSSSLAIRNDQGELIGSLCLNLSLEPFLEMSGILAQLTALAQPSGSAVEEFHRGAPREEIRDAIASYLRTHQLSTRALTSREKKTLVLYLYERGYFNQRAAVTLIAQELGVTRPSIYNYLRGSEYGTGSH